MVLKPNPWAPKANKSWSKWPLEHDPNKNDYLCRLNKTRFTDGEGSDFQKHNGGGGGKLHLESVCSVHCGEDCGNCSSSVENLMDSLMDRKSS